MAAWTWYSETSSPAMDRSKWRNPSVIKRWSQRLKSWDSSSTRSPASSTRAGRRQRGSRYQQAQAQRLRTEIVADQVLALVRGVAFVEHQVDHLHHRIQAPLQVRRARQLEREPSLPDQGLGAHQPLRDSGFLRQKGAGDFAHAEAAGDLETQGHAGIPRDLGMAAHEDHAQLIVAELLLEILAARRRLAGLRQFHDQGLG